MRPLQNACICCILAAMAACLAAPAQAAEKKADVDKRGIMQNLFGDTVDHFPLQPFTISVIRDGQVASLMSVGIVIETVGAANRDKVVENHVRVHDALLRELHGFMSIERGDGRTFDARNAKLRLVRAGERVLGAGVINNILVQNLSDRPLQ